MKKYACLGLVLVLLCLSACARRPASTAEVPRLISQSYRVSVAPFTQPLNPGQLITGQIPENQGQAPQDALLLLDMDLRDALQADSTRHFNFIPRQNLHQELNYAHATGQPGALPRWIQYGKKHDAQLLLVPMVLNWHEREGSQAGVTTSAEARVEFFLLNIGTGSVMDRSVYEEKQVGLVDNLLTVADFVRRKGQWVEARDLAKDGMAKAIKELGL